MKKSLILVSCTFFLISTALVAQNKFIGSAKCKMCHNAPDKGVQYTKWAGSKHSKAFETLASDKAKEIGKTQGIAEPSKDAKCLKCHATAAGISTDLLSGLTLAEGVSCESCHGAGSAYKNPAVMKNLADSKAKGLITPDEKVCVKCHNSDSPTFKSFDFKTYYDKVSHKNPKNKK